MASRSEYVKRWRELTKQTIVKAMGGKCCICGYDKCNEALDIHHKNPYEKDFSVGSIIANPKSWSKIVAELKKCVLLCANHHREVHNGITIVPTDACGFNDDFTNFRKPIVPKVFDKCPICGKVKHVFSLTCSRACAAKRARTIKWNDINIVELNKKGQSNRAIGEIIGVSGAAVYKRLKKLGLSSHYVIKEKKYCSECGVEIHKGSKSGLCMGCFNVSRRKMKRPSKEQLEQEISEIGYCALGRQYGVSDNAVRKWAKSYGITV